MNTAERLTKDDLDDILAEHADDPETLALWQAFADDLSAYCADWEYGESAIRDSSFTDYAQELAEDLGAINSDGAWPTYCIDWEWAARELQHDYSAVEDPDGVTWWIR